MYAKHATAEQIIIRTQRDIEMELEHEYGDIKYSLLLAHAKRNPNTQTVVTDESSHALTSMQKQIDELKRNKVQILCEYNAIKANENDMAESIMQLKQQVQRLQKQNEDRKAELEALRKELAAQSSNTSRSNNNIYDVEEILDHKTVRGKYHYWIKWEGYSHKDNTWEPEKNISNTTKFVEYCNKHNLNHSKYI